MMEGNGKENKKTNSLPQCKLSQCELKRSIKRDHGMTGPCNKASDTTDCERRTQEKTNTVVLAIREPHILLVTNSFSRLYTGET